MDSNKKTRESTCLEGELTCLARTLPISDAPGHGGQFNPGLSTVALEHVDQQPDNSVIDRSFSGAMVESSF